MTDTIIRWIGGQQFIGIDSTKHSVVLSSVQEDVGMKSSELMIVALGACTAASVVGILEKKRTPLTSLEIKSSFVQDEDPPWAFRKIHLHYILKGKNLKEKDVNRAIELSEQKYCSVSATLRGVAEITWDFEIMEA